MSQLPFKAINVILKYHLPRSFKTLQRYYRLHCNFTQDFTNNLILLKKIS